MNCDTVLFTKCIINDKIKWETEERVFSYSKEICFSSRKFAFKVKKRYHKKYCLHSFEIIADLSCFFYH